MLGPFVLTDLLSHFCAVVGGGLRVGQKTLNSRMIVRQPGNFELGFDSNMGVSGSCILPPKGSAG